MSATEQPLYIDEDDKVTKCRWCGDHFKGSVQLKYINQHVKKAAFHIQKRREITHKGAKQCDIRNFFHATDYELNTTTMADMDG